MAERADIVIVLPPFAPADCPSLAASILVAGCRNRGLSASAYYPSLDFGLEVGFDRYRKVATSCCRTLVGEAVFQDFAFPEAAAAVGVSTYELAFGEESSVASLADRKAGLTKEDALVCHEAADGFLDRAVERILAYEPKIVGFSSVFQQNLASIALARRLKRRASHVVTVLGGAHAAEPMGSALADVVDEYDVVFSGEADFAFPEFCREFLEKGAVPETRVVSCPPVFDLDETPIPDYSDYFLQAKPLVDAGHTELLDSSWLNFESSRGCWYGAKSHCKFCGLNALEIGYRRKSADRILTELHLAIRDHRPERMAATDNIMPIELKRDVLPRLEQEPIDVSLFYEVKANLAAVDLDQFVLAGVTWIQPGIESLSTNVLKAMAKGVSGPHNIWLLRECLSRRIRVAWNLLAGVPGETRDDYEAMLEVIPLLEHLYPPDGPGLIRLDRYSPYFEHAADYDIENIRPFPAFDLLYTPEADKPNIAYHFAGEYSTEYLDDEPLHLRVKDAVRAWRAAWYEEELPPRLFAVELSSDDLLIEDTRSCAGDRFFIASGALRRTLLGLQGPLRRDRLPTEREKDVRELMRRGYVVEHEDRLIGIVTDPGKGVSLRNRREARREELVSEPAGEAGGAVEVSVASARPKERAGGSPQT